MSGAEMTLRYFLLRTEKVHYFGGVAVMSNDGRENDKCLQ